MNTNTEYKIKKNWILLHIGRRTHSFQTYVTAVMSNDFLPNKTFFNDLSPLLYCRKNTLTILLEQKQKSNLENDE